MPSGIVREIKQSRPFASKSEEAAVALLRTTDLVRRSIAGVVEPHGITMQQYNVLRILRGAGARGLPTLEIAQRMIEQTPGITRLIDRLEKKKLVSRRRCAEDRRCVYCIIGDAGLALLAKLDGPVTAAADAVFNIGNKIGNKRELGRLVVFLDRLRQRLNSEILQEE